MAATCNNLGMVYTKMGEWQAAQEMLEQAVTAYRALGDVYNWANAMDNLAELYEVQGETAVSSQVLQEAITGLQAISEARKFLDLGR